MDQSDLSRRKMLQGALLTGALAGWAAETNNVAAAEEQGEGAKSESQGSTMDRIKAIFQSKDPATWVITGDSITHGALHTKGWRSYSEHFAERVRWELARVRDIVINTGISGDRTGGLLADYQWRALRFGPTVVSIMLGMNDCAAGKDGREIFSKNLTALVEQAQAAKALVLLNTPNTVYIKNSKGREDLPAYAQLVRDVAAATGAALVDHWKHWEAAKPDQETLLPWIEDQSIHPGVYGHREFAKLIFKELGIYDDKSPTCTLEVP